MSSPASWCRATRRTSSTPPPTGSTPSLSLDAQHLLELGDDLDQILLILHRLVDALVGARDLVEDAVILAALDTLGLLPQILQREALLRRRARHAPTGPVRCRLERLGVAATAHDVRARSHRARDDAELTG